MFELLFEFGLELVDLGIYVFKEVVLLDDTEGLGLVLCNSLYLDEVLVVHNIFVKLLLVVSWHFEAEVILTTLFVLEHIDVDLARVEILLDNDVNMVLLATFVVI